MPADRADPFATLDISDFKPAPAKKPPVPKEAIRRVSEENQFPSRAPVPLQPAPQPEPPPQSPAQKRATRVYRTGRNVPFMAKVTAETHAKGYALLDRLGTDGWGNQVTLGELLSRAFTALERELEGKKK